jgi:hypothetical protein
MKTMNYYSTISKQHSVVGSMPTALWFAIANNDRTPEQLHRVREGWDG